MTNTELDRLFRTEQEIRQILHDMNQCGQLSDRWIELNSKFKILETESESLKSQIESKLAQADKAKEYLIESIDANKLASNQLLEIISLNQELSQLREDYEEIINKHKQYVNDSQVELDTNTKELKQLRNQNADLISQIDYYRRENRDLINENTQLRPIVQALRDWNNELDFNGWLKKKIESILASSEVKQ